MEGISSVYGVTGQAYLATVTAQDANGDTLSYSLSGDVPTGLTLDTLTGQLNWPTPVAGFYDLTLTATDPTALSASQAYRLHINTAPSVISAPQTSMEYTKS